MERNDFDVEWQQLGRTSIVVARDRMGEDLSTSTGMCNVPVEHVLGRISTLPGPDEEVVIDIQISKRRRESE
jgi:hypothetical protein